MQPLLQAQAVGAGAIKAATGLLAAEGARDVPDEVPGLCQPLADAPLQARQEGAALMRWQEARACIRCASASEAELSAREFVGLALVLQWCPNPSVWSTLWCNLWSSMCWHKAWP